MNTPNSWSDKLVGHNNTITNLQTGRPLLVVEPSGPWATRLAPVAAPAPTSIPAAPVLVISSNYDAYEVLGFGRHRQYPLVDGPRAVEPAVQFGAITLTALTLFALVAGGNLRLAGGAARRDVAQNASVRLTYDPAAGFWSEDNEHPGRSGAPARRLWRPGGPDDRGRGLFAGQRGAPLFAIQGGSWAPPAALRREGLWPVAGKDVLEVGCGTGGLLLEWLGYGAEPRRLHGVDLLAERVAVAHDRLPHLAVSCSSGAALPYADHSFDLVLTIHVVFIDFGSGPSVILSLAR